MDAVEFLKKERSMCERYKNMCKDCPVSSEKSGEKLPCYALRMHNPERYCSIIKKWADEHPAKTRQSEFLKMFPNAPLNEFVILGICPMDVDRDRGCPKSGAKCIYCRKEYWSAEGE